MRRNLILKLTLLAICLTTVLTFNSLLFAQVQDGKCPCFNAQMILGICSNPNLTQSANYADGFIKCDSLDGTKLDWQFTAVSHVCQVLMLNPTTNRGIERGNNFLTLDQANACQDELEMAICAVEETQGECPGLN